VFNIFYFAKERNHKIIIKNIYVHIQNKMATPTSTINMSPHHTNNQFWFAITPVQQ
jgi:hypothetical protein